MKKNILFYFLFLTYAFYGQNLSVEVIYDFGTDNKKITITDEFKFFENTEFRLICNNTKSRFELIEKSHIDASKVNKNFVALAGASGIFYKDLAINEHLRTKSFRKESFIISNIPYDNRYKWKLTKETKKIGGYICYKAVHTDSGELEGRKFSIETVVYYAPDLLLPFGPIHFYGLPGLVLEAQSHNYYFIAKKVEVYNDKKIDIPRPKIGKEVEYIKNMKKFIKHDSLSLKKNLIKKIEQEEQKNKN